ncbi:DHA2 family efflux MFS transporter permease subunit [Caulobacter sp. S45]|uniref:DHA2 family efflux MFS transporter permease subunit n=1 Tax=Caulobacter sp. S45 TaxID=1641861 RepID=UPI00131E56A5|nr:DHA2 family efflux MFS transporter permease subunit [Caulobacter sp. S45]
MAAPSDSGAPLTAVERNPNLRLLIPGIVAIGFLMEMLDTTIITTAIPAMAKTLRATPLAMNLAVTTYVLTLAVFIPVSGWFADRFGARRIFALALLTFTLGSVLCGLAVDLPMLIATRALQGLGGAMMTPVGRLILIRSFPRNQLVKAMTYMTLPAIVGPVVGPVLGGFLTTYASWRWIFFINIPFGLLGTVLALRFIEDGEGEAPKPFDVPGFVLFGLGVALLQYGLEGVGRGGSPLLVAAILGGAVVMLLVFAVHARRIAAPMVDLTLFRNRAFSVGTLAGGLCRIGMNGTPFLLPLMLQIGFGLSPFNSGLLTFVSAIGILGIRPVCGRLLATFGFDRVLIGSAVLAAMVTAGFALFGPHTPHWILAIYMLAFGMVRATQFMASNSLSYADLPRGQLSGATSLGGVLQQLSVSFGVSVAATLLGLFAGPAHLLTPTRFHEVFLAMSLIPLLALPGFLTLRPEDGVQVSGHVRGRRRDPLSQAAQ